MADAPLAPRRRRLTFARLSGLDRSGPPPPETRKGAPLRPWTIPNAIGYVRLALIPTFVALAYGEPDGQGTAAAVIFAVVAWTDYADGIAARVTGQYSRLGTLLDPLTDRLLVLAGAVVCFDFSLLPRWALIALAVREAYALAISRYGMTHGADIKINWPGRIGVWPTMSALFFALAGADVLAEILLYVGLFFSYWAAALYTRDGLAVRAGVRASG